MITIDKVFTSNSEKQKLIEKFLLTRANTEFIAKMLNTEELAIQAFSDASPMKWHLAHTSWYFENFLLVPYLNNYKLFSKDFNYLFNSYYNSFGDRLDKSQRKTLNFPRTNEILEYRNYVTENVIEYLNINDEIPIYLLNLGIAHEEQHQELALCDIKYLYGHNYYQEALILKKEEKIVIPEDFEFLEFSEGIYDIGISENDVNTSFAFDNESPHHKVFLHNFGIANRVVTNAEYAEFIEAGGYSTPSLWLDEGWEFVTKNKIKAPLYWNEENGSFYNYKFTGKELLNELEPVCHVSFYEAEAYSRFMGYRLPTEQEWEIACNLIGEEDNLLDFDTNLHPRYKKDNNHFLGNTWQWTYSAYHPYPNYKSPENALGEYNGKFMINQMVLRGGSCVTPQGHIRETYRNFFHPEKRWQFSSIRLAK
jgi:ergothioneine biosynthesis protein EgtB